jgi:hemoglobin-like flavoprotein
MTLERGGPAPATAGVLRAVLLRDAKRLMAEQGDIVARLFYLQLLRRHPRMAGLLAGSDIEQQSATLASMLQALIEYADQPQELGVRAIKLGAAHASRGLRRQDYADFNETLSEVLAEWQSAVPVEVARRIWLADLNAVADIMLIVGAQ